MSGWDGWITFIEDCCKNRSAADIREGGASAATWLFRLGDRDSGAMWASSPGFPAIADGDAAKMSSASTGDDMSIFGAPPPPYSFLRAVDCDSCMVLTGKDKTIPGRMCYVSRTETAVMICLVDITNINKGAEGNALDAFSYGIGQVKENGV